MVRRRRRGVDDCCGHKGEALERMALKAEQKRVLKIVLALNAGMFVAEFGAGLVAGSAALIADSGDMLSDALVYALSLYAIERSARWKAGAAMVKGVMILILALAVLVDVALTLKSGVAPSSTLMLLFGSLALIVNALCVRLLWRFRAQDVNMSSVFECSRNDAISNVGVLAAAAGVALTASPWPDMLVGAVMALLFLRSAARVIASAWPTLRTAG
jgi:cation diffusion facilitator family transporter